MNFFSAYRFITIQLESEQVLRLQVFVSYFKIFSGKKNCLKWILKNKLVYVCVCMSVCVCACGCLPMGRVHMCMHACVFIYVLCVCTRVSLCVSVFMCVHVCVYVCVHVSIGDMDFPSKDPDYAINLHLTYFRDLKYPNVIKNMK